MQNDSSQQRRRIILSAQALEDAHLQATIARKNGVIDKLAELNGQQRRRIAELEIELVKAKMKGDE